MMINNESRAVKELELYIHIPFCVQKCAYCDFLSAPADENTRQKYVDALKQEIQGYKKIYQNYNVTTVFLGGGTPSILNPVQIEEIFSALHDSFQITEGAEITIEVNPGTVTEEKLQAWKGAGINRISIGLQSTEDRELRMLGRIHDHQQFLDTWGLVRRAGMENVNVDLISAVPGQTLESWQRTLRKTAELGPEHLSVYSLIIEEGTPFYDRYGKAPKPSLPDEETERLMYEETGKILKEYGYARYEISNYAKPGYVCRHNLGYWNRTDYKGFGLGAASLLNNVRTANQTKFWEYLKGNREGSAERLSKQAIREEHFFLGLRKTEGVAPGEYREHYQELITRLKEQGLLKEEDAKVRLTDFGIDVSNYVLAQFLD